MAPEIEIYPQQADCLQQAVSGESVMADSNPYGYCPLCGAPVELRERRWRGNDICKNGHEYPSSMSVKDQSHVVEPEPQDEPT